MARTEPRPDHQAPPAIPAPAASTRGDSRGGSARGERGRHVAHAPWRIVRSPADRILAGVAGGLGERLEVDPVIVRLAFVVLAFAAGAGVIAYLGCWALSVNPPPDAPMRPPVPTSTERGVAIGMVVGGLLLMFRGVGAWFGDAVVWPVVLGAVGSAIIWTRADRD